MLSRRIIFENVEIERGYPWSVDTVVMFSEPTLVCIERARLGDEGASWFDREQLTRRKTEAGELLVTALRQYIERMLDDPTVRRSYAASHFKG